ncbi:hypothetical protein SARC_12985 [Sphaeroforma arctica JP610]|uniref:EGF-like domain-containing protein n=1 Tax=Sphaeroforma arctica JP610 TaxID=667725 RepID=A0A0L0FCH9_9EUKA|nr:hypothetical protein SARC_12985 [Sphaeroforma arctica JP610]KNC74470.1 hypothetical protein SARC_12985 [Sphaeroforma arctica JP610]|eukprot:XP_014148372.1 hypothetical protein SARC_12985 [Sphaeroforma arctica JP610]
MNMHRVYAIAIAVALCCQSVDGQTHHTKVDNLAKNFPPTAYPGINLGSFPIYDPSRGDTHYSSTVQNIDGSNTVYALKDGRYSNVDIVVSNGAVLRARNMGKVIFSGNVRVTVKSGGILDGITFTDAYPIGTGMVEVNHGRVTRCSFLNLRSPPTETESKRCVYGRGGAQLIDHNLFQNLCLSSLTVIVHADGPSLTYRNRFVTQCQDFTAEVWRVGGSSSSNKNAHAFVDENYFIDQNGEHELLSIKASSVHVRGNTVLSSQGAITNRYGSDNEIARNYIECRSSSSGAIRSFGRNQVISNNYMTGCRNGYGIALGLGYNCYGYQGNCEYEAGLGYGLDNNVLEDGSALVVGDNGKGNICPTYTEVRNNRWYSTAPRTNNGCSLPPSNLMDPPQYRAIRPSPLTPADTGPFVRQSQYFDACSSVPCGRGGSCRNDNGGTTYTCTCFLGYGKSGNTCVDIDQCKVNPCGEGRGVCTDAEGEYSCACFLGYELSQSPTGPVCELIDNCIGHTCGEGTCVNGLATYTCDCKAGYKQSDSGLVCEKIDYCVGNTCGNGACASGSLGYTCSCNTGYELSLDGASCVDIDECARAPNICGTGAVCSNIPGHYTCACIDGYQLAPDMITCERTVSVCDSQPCLNNGVCAEVGTDGGFTCDCTNTGYEGSLCDTPEKRPCDGEPCFFGGYCVERISGYSCYCVPGRLGENCELDFDECASNPCVAGTCSNRHNKFVCICTTGWCGETCTQRCP